MMDTWFDVARRFQCVSTKCSVCGFTEHGLTPGDQIEPKPCWKCGSRELGTVDSHAHLMFTEEA